MAQPRIELTELVRERLGPVSSVGSFVRKAKSKEGEYI